MITPTLYTGQPSRMTHTVRSQSRNASRGSLFVAGAVSLFFGGTASAHDKWLEVATPAASTPAKVYLMTGEALQQAEPLPERRVARVRRFDWVSAAGRRDLLSALREDAQPIAVTPPLPVGTHVLRFDGPSLNIELEAAKFAAYLLEERLVDILTLRVQDGQEDARGRERYSRSLKAILQVGVQYDAVATQPLGQELELVPLRHPLRPSTSKDLAVRVLFRGQPLAGRAVSLAERYRSRTTEVFRRTDAQGVAHFTVEPRGEWLVRMIHMQRASESGEPPDATIDWRSYWSSLYFGFPDPHPNPTLPANK